MRTTVLRCAILASLVALTTSGETSLAQSSDGLITWDAAGPASREACNALLLVDIHDRYSYVRSAKIDQVVHELLCDAMVRTGKREVGGGASAVIPIESINIPIEIKGSDTSNEQFQRKVCDHRSVNLSARDDAAIIFSNVNTAAVDAWKACVTTPSHPDPGVHARTIPADGAAILLGEPFTVVVSWLGTGEAPTVSNVDVKGGASCHGFAAGTKLLEVSDNAFLCTRTSYEPVAIVVATDRGSIPINLRPAPKPPGELPALVVEDDDIEFSATYSVQNYESITFKGKGRIVVRNGGSLIVKAARILSENGAVARFAAIGKPGRQGPTGAPCDACSSGAAKSRDSGEFNRWQRDCRSGNASPADYGKPGGAGYPGDGADIEINVRQILGSFECLVEHGPGGQGGARGPGRRICDQECSDHHRYDFCAPVPDRTGKGRPSAEGESTCAVKRLQ